MKLMHMDCQPLIKAIDAYIFKADKDLEDVLRDEGYAESEKTLKYMQDIEDGVANALLAETDYIIAEAEKAIDLESFAKEIWPDTKLNDKLKKKITAVFIEQFSEFMPEFVSYYLTQTDKDLTLKQVSKRTTAWVTSWSKELGEIMQLKSHEEIESILTKGLEKGSGIAEFTREIIDSGIRNEYYKARRVAVTEVLTAHRAAAQEAYMQSPSVEDKAWRHTGAYRNKSRQNHVDMDGTRVPKDKPFVLIGADGSTYYPMYPGDPALPPGERINCHCIDQPIVSEKILGLSLEERQRLQQESIDAMDDEWERELDAKNKAKAGIDIEPYGTNVTNQYVRAATPGKGNIEYGAGYRIKGHQQEISTANYIHEKFGGNIELLSESTKLNEKTPDFMWNGKYWELKTVSTEKAADSALRSALKQIQKNPGGVILDYNKNKVSKEELQKILLGRFKRTGLNSLDIMVLTNDRTTVEVFRYKK